MSFRSSFLRKAAAVLTLTGLLCAGFSAAHAAGPHYKYINVPGGTNTTAYGVNALKQIAGTYQDANYNAQGFLFSGGVYTTLAPPTAILTQATGINEFGQVVGTYVTQDAATGNYNSRGFVYYHGAYTSFDVNLPDVYPGSLIAQGINDWGQIVGSYVSTTYPNNERGFVLCHGVATAFDAPNSPNATIPMGINDLGQIVGYYTTGGKVTSADIAEHGFVLSNGVYTTLDEPNATNGLFFIGTQANGINIFGQVVGTYSDAGGAEHGFLWQGGHYTTIDSPNAVNTELFGINAEGQILGYDEGATIGQGFLLTR